MWGAAPVTGRYTRCGALHPLRGAAPFTSRYTRCGALHPIRRGAMPTDRVQRHFQQALSRPRDHTNHQPTSTPPPPTSAAPFTSRYTRCGALHPFRRGAMPTDRVQRPTQQALSRTRTAHLIPHRHTCRPHLEHLPLWVWLSLSSPSHTQHLHQQRSPRQLACC